MNYRIKIFLVTITTLLLIFTSCSIIWQKDYDDKDSPSPLVMVMMPRHQSDDNPYQPIVRGQDTKLIKLETNDQLVYEVREKWLTKPSQLPYNFTVVKNNYDAIKRMHATTIRMLNYKKNGFFVEAGAYNGVDWSNTLNLEMDYNWTGLLVEADPIYFEQLKSKNRKAYIINACLGPHSYAEKIRMTRIRDQGALSRITKDAPKHFVKMLEAQDFETQCFPFATILAATLGNHQPLIIDYLSLDIEEAELSVLSTIPWDYVYIKVITVETWPSNDYELTKFLESQNYKMVKRFVGDYVHDNLYVNRRHLGGKYLE